MSEGNKPLKPPLRLKSSTSTLLWWETLNLTCFMSVIILLVGSICQWNHDTHCLVRLSAYMGKVGDNGDLRVHTLSMPSDIHLWAEISTKEEKLHGTRKSKVLNTPPLCAACCVDVSRIERSCNDGTYEACKWQGVKQPTVVNPYLHYKLILMSKMPE